MKIKLTKNHMCHTYLIKNSRIILVPITLFSLLLICNSCKKTIDIAPPKNSITTSQVFADSADAAAAVAGIYSATANSGVPGFGNGVATLYCGLSADELLYYNSAGDYASLNSNSIIAGNSLTSFFFWQQEYPILYLANATIEGLQASKTISQGVKNKLIGDAEFFRAFFNFYLVNLYGDIPLITTTDYKSNSIAARTSKALVYQAIIKDLKDAQNQLPSDYSAQGGERTRANKWAATALLARVYLYMGEYENAAIQASAVINNSGLYSLPGDLNNVFLKNSSEAILQWHDDSRVNLATYNATAEGYTIIPIDSLYPPSFYLTNQLLNTFEAGDKRITAWVQTYTYSGDGNSYSYPYKYKVGPAQVVANGPVTEYYMVLRLAEQYLIRAEAEANGAPGDAIADLNKIRNRAGLPGFTGATGAPLLAAIAHERQVELFAEWGHRWLDLKRTGKAHAVLSTIIYKQPWKGDYQLLYPVPPAELQADPNLTQNPGY